MKIDITPLHIKIDPPTIQNNGDFEYQVEAEVTLYVGDAAVRSWTLRNQYGAYWDDHMLQTKAEELVAEELRKLFK